MDFFFTAGSLDQLFKKLQVQAAVERAKRSNRHTLILTSFDINHFPKGILELQYLYKLCLSKNALVSLPEEISALENLAILSVSRNKLACLTKGLFCIESLRKLNLSHNPISVLPPEIGQLVNLEVLWLNRTGLRCLPPEIKNLTQLDTLGARGNFLSELPHDLYQLQSLSGNQIKQLSETKWNNLIHLNMSKNEFVELPASLLGMEKLRYCFFTGNPLKIVSRQLLKGLAHLALLDLRDCGVVNVNLEKFIFVELKKERELEGDSSESDEDWLDSVNSSELDSSTDEQEDIPDAMDKLVLVPFISKYAQGCSK